jgi:ADP-heptose:LPS heptosyltransferase
MRTAPPRSILVIVEDCGPGEATCWAACLPGLRAAHPDAEMVLLVGEQAAPVFENSTLFDRVVVSDLYARHRRPPAVPHLARVVRMLRLLHRVGGGHDLVVILGWGTTLVDLLGWVAGRRRIGYSNAMPMLLTSRLGRWDVDGDMTTQNLRLLAAGGIPVADERGSWSVQTDLDDAAVRRLLEEHDLLSRPLVVLHPGSDWACQQWLPQRWAELADSLVEHRRLAPVFTGVEAEDAFIEGIRGRMRHSSTSLVGRTTLGQLQALVAAADLCVSVDCVAHDLALAAGTPTVVIAGGASYAQRSSSGPLPVIVVDRTPPPERRAIRRCKESKTMHQCLDYECSLWGLRAVRVDDVRAAVDAVLSPEPVEHRRPLRAST